MKALFRARRIGRVLLRYRLDTLLEGTSAERWLRLAKPFVPRASVDIAKEPRGRRLRLALQELGPIFVKFGQILSTRRDLIPHDIAEELVLLQDRVQPFSGVVAQQRIEQSLGKPVSALFNTFSQEPIASASIAQVHAARLHDGREVVVKVLRPGISEDIEGDIALLRSLALLVERTHPHAARIRPRQIVAEIESTLRAELDMQREAANASVIRRMWIDSPDLYIPEILWSHTADGVLTQERVYGIPADAIEKLDALGINRKLLAEKGVRIFYTQVFRDNFFHADAHAGNIWVDTDPAFRENPRFIALDFGVVGQLSLRDQYYLAENFMAIFRKDYHRIASLHVEAGWMPGHIRLEELEAAARTVCEPYFTRPLSEISLAELLIKLFRIAQQHQLTVQPQLILLQKTLLNIEGVGRRLDPELDIWRVARPVLARILRRRYSMRHVLTQGARRIPQLMTYAPEVPGLLHEALSQHVNGQHQIRIQSEQLEKLHNTLYRFQRRVVIAIIGSGLLIVAAVIYGLHPNHWHWGPLSLWGWAATVMGIIALLLACVK